MRIASAAVSLLLTTTVVAQQKPSEVLSLFFHNHLDRILSPIGQPKPVLLPRARVTQLREQFADQFSKAPDTDKPMYQAAVAVCDAVAAAMDERQKAIASLQGSSAVHGPSDLGARRKDIPTRGSWADAQLAGLELQREGHEEQNRKQEAAQNDNFFNTQLKTNWSQRAQSRGCRGGRTSCGKPVSSNPRDSTIRWHSIPRCGCTKCLCRRRRSRRDPLHGSHSCGNDRPSPSPPQGRRQA